MNMKRFGNALGLAALFTVSFVFFLYLTFPYEVLKETLAAELSRELGQSVRIGEMGPKLPIGVEAENITIIPPDGPGLQLGGVTLRVGVLPLFIGRIDVGASIKSRGGYLDVNAQISIFDIAQGHLVPSALHLEADKFPLEEIVAFALGAAAKSDGMSPMLAPLLGAVGLSANLTGKVDLDLDVTNPAQSSGEVELQLMNAKLKLSGQNLGLKDQEFSRAMIKARVSQGQLVLDKQSGLLAEELALGLTGRIALNQVPLRSNLEIDGDLKLTGELLDQYQLILNAVTGGFKDGQVTIKVRGPLAAPQVTTI